MAHSKKGGRLYSINPRPLYSINPINRHDMTPNPTKEEIDALEREIQQQQKQRNRRVRRAVNPERGFGC